MGEKKHGVFREEELGIFIKRGKHVSAASSIIGTLTFSSGLKRKKTKRIFLKRGEKSHLSSESVS